jgi:ankyrin repeat protein
VDALDHTGMTPLHWASRKGNQQIVELLIQSKATAMARNKLDMTPLHEARTIPVAKLLLAAGADINARNIDGMTPLHTASTEKVAQFLIKKGGNLHARAKDGRTPMDMPPVPTPRVKK